MRLLTKLRGRDVFARIFRTGTRWVNRWLVLFLTKGDSSAIRAGITVSRRFGKAVRRNRIRRVLWEFLRTREQLLEEGWDMVILPRKGLEELRSSDQTAGLESLLKRSGILRAHAR